MSEKSVHVGNHRQNKFGTIFSPQAKGNRKEVTNDFTIIKKHTNSK